MSDNDGKLVGYFGFGSLVNRHTLRTSYIDVVPASLKGWRRHWQARTDTLEQDVALLSIHPDTSCTINGMLVIDHLANLSQVDEREAGYSRVSLTLDNLVIHKGHTVPDELYVYVADESELPDTGSLLQSYLDAVMQGFHNEYGEDGVRHFVDTTRHFERSLIRDRSNPMYPRSVEVSGEQAALFDRELARAGIID